MGAWGAVVLLGSQSDGCCESEDSKCKAKLHETPLMNLLPSSGRGAYQVRLGKRNIHTGSVQSHGMVGLMPIWKW